VYADAYSKHFKVRFGAFEFDVRRQELRRQGHLIRLPAAQLRLLNLFLERPGELITRDEITARLWVDSSAIDVSDGINTSINRLRGNLNDPRSPAAYIETVIGLGYRFVSEVTTDPVPAVELQETPATPQTQPGAAPPAQSEPVTPANPVSAGMPSAPAAPLTRRPLPFRGLLAVGSLIVLAVVVTVALRWNARTKLPDTPASATKPSPLPFHLRPVTSNISGETITAAAVSPDGKAVAYSNRAGVSIHVFGGSDRLLPSRPFFQVSRVSWYPDGTQVLISGTDMQTHQHQVMSHFLWRGYLQLLVDDADLAVVSPKGDFVAYTRQNNTELWVADGEGKNPRKLLTDARGSFPFLIWSFTGDQLLVDHRAQSPASDSYESIDVPSGAVLAHNSGIAFTSGFVLEDGRLYFPIAGSENPASGETQLMMVHTDPRTGKPLDQPHAQQTIRGYGGTLSASLDGRRLALALDYSTVNVFVADLHQPGPALENVRELPHNVEESYPHAWTPDGQAVLSENSALGVWAIFKQPIDGTPQQLVAKLPTTAAMAQITPDDRWIMFLEFQNGKSLSGESSPVSIFRVPFAGGDATQIMTSGQIVDFRCPLIAGGTCVVRETIGNTALVYNAIDPATGIGRELARTPWHPIVMGDWGLSPDGSIISVTDHDLTRPTLHLIPLSSGPKAIPSEIPLRGHGTLLSSSWAADGHSLFVQCRTKDGFELVSLDRTGKLRLLHKSSVPIWAIPSHDGKKIAFPERTSSNDVWASDTPQ
jgi:DNA-binding winged helix-turn-helix (wHTH) protein